MPRFFFQVFSVHGLKFALALLFCLCPVSTIFGQTSGRTFSGVIVTQQFELVPGVDLEIETSGENLTTKSDSEGAFSLRVPDGPLTVRFSGNNIEPFSRIFAPGEKTENLRIKIDFVVPPVSEQVIIEDNSLAPNIETRNDSIYANTLFGRDDQLIQTLNAGINAGQHEGGGKSLEIRRFGFNTDHGGVGGGLKILVDNIQQNQGTQGHGQGYLGSLKSLSPELVEDVSIINGPFSAAYGDFSGLGVVKVDLKESLPQRLTLRLQAGSFDTYRAFIAYSPQIEKVKSFIAYEFSRTDGPFENPLNYRRDNVTGNFTRKLGENQTVGLKFNAGRNVFTSSGQIPLDLVNSGRLDRFGFIDPENGGEVRLGTLGAYYRREWTSGATLKADAFVGRSLFDLFSNFTFFLADPVYGDEIQQHDSRLQEGANLQFLAPYNFFGRQALLTVGGNFLANQINVGLYPTVDRNPNRKFLPENISNPDVLYTSAHANVNNYGGYLQNALSFFNGHVRIETGLRFDVFTFDVRGLELGGTDEPVESEISFSCDQFSALNSSCRTLAGRETAAKLQPKLSLAWSPFETFPITFYANYGRGISSQDARGVARNPDAPKISTTDFHQVGTSYNSRRFSAVFSTFLIDRSNEQVYIPDDGSIEFAGRSRSYGIELRNSIRLNRFLSFDGGLTQVLKAFYPGQFSDNGRRIYVDSAPHTVANGGLVLAGFHGFNSAISWRHISGYRLDGENDSLRAAGQDVVDFSLTKRLKKWVDLNFSIDNLLDKDYYETQNFFESRACPACQPFERIHAAPGYPITFNFGLTFRLFAKD
ncbi:MAG: TonB-dependent receptor [Pyrinomonadaceae bacterium]